MTPPNPLEPLGLLFVRWMDEATHECLRDDGLRKWYDAAFASPTFVARSIQEAQHHIVCRLIEDAEEYHEEGEDPPIPTHADFRWEWGDKSNDGLLFLKNNPVAYASCSPLHFLLVEPQEMP